MLSLADVVAQHTDLGEDDLEHLGRLVQEWDLLADLSFSDLILWVPDVDPNVFWAAAQVRPTTGPTALEDDVVGDEISYEPDSLVMEAFLSEQIARTSGNKLHAGIPVEQIAVPVRREGRVIAIVEMHTNRMGVRAPGMLEETYLDLAEVLRTMLLHGEFPMPGDKPVPWISPRVVDGALRVDSAGNIIYASPNAVSAFRRLGFPGDLLGELYADVMAALPAETREPVDRAVSGQLKGPLEYDLDSRGASVRLRVQPLICAGGHAGFLVMCRDTTELRSRERQLVTKDATIREIHHRVKNNLQTVSAILRLQSRRTESAEAHTALRDAQERVTAIAVVHEILSQGFDTSVRFDDVADRLLAMMREVATMGHVAMRREGTFGLVPAVVATSLSLVLTEITQNAIEHGLCGEPGTVTVIAHNHDDQLVMEVVNDGQPLPENFQHASAKTLGLSIVATLVSDLGGTFSMHPSDDRSRTVARVEIPLR